MGKFARSKGRRGEIAVRDYLRKMGWKAERVPGSGAFSYRSEDKDANLLHDVTAEKDGRKLRFECKYHEVFGSLYALYEEHCKVRQDDVLSFVCPGEDLLCLSVSTSLDALFDGPDFYEFQERHPLYSKYSRQFKKLAGMQKMLKGADILVLKKNNKPLLWVRYR